MAVYKALKSTNLRRIKEGTTMDGNNVAEFEPYGGTGQHKVVASDQKVEVDDKHPVYGGYIVGTKNVDTKKKYFKVTSIKGPSPTLVPGVDLYVFAEDMEYVP